MRTIINNILNDNKCFYYKLDENTLMIKSDKNNYATVNELITIIESLKDKNINYKVDEDENICIITD